MAKDYWDSDDWFALGKQDAEDGFVRAPAFFYSHADWQNYLAGVRAAVL